MNLSEKEHKARKLLRSISSEEGRVNRSRLLAQYGRHVGPRGATRSLQMAARLEAFAAVYGETKDDALASQIIGVTVTTGERLLRQLRQEGRA